MGCVLGWTVSSLIIRAPCEIFADMEDMGTIPWQVFYHARAGTDPQHLPHCLTVPRQFLDWRAGGGLVVKDYRPSRAPSCLQATMGMRLMACQDPSGLGLGRIPGTRRKSI